MATCKEFAITPDTVSLDISVVIPAHNSARTIGPCINSILACGTPQPREIIVVDSGVDGTDKVLREAFPQVRYYHSPSRLLPGGARNIGWRQATGSIIAFLDSDCMVEQNWLRNIAKAHREDRDVVTGSFEMANPVDGWGFVVFCAELGGSLPTRPPGRSRLTPSGNSSYKRHLLDLTGGFREDMFCEDTILAHRLISQGYRVHFSPDIKVFHVNREGYPAFKASFFRSGYYSGIARSMFKLKGYMFAELPMLIPLLIPYRFLNIFWTNRTYATSHSKRLIKLTPLVVFAAFLWTYAFWKGVRLGKDTSEQH